MFTFELVTADSILTKVGGGAFRTRGRNFKSAFRRMESQVEVQCGAYDIWLESTDLQVKDPVHQEISLGREFAPLELKH